MTVKKKMSSYCHRITFYSTQTFMLVILFVITHNLSTFIQIMFNTFFVQHVTVDIQTTLVKKTNFRTVRLPVTNH